MRNVYVSPYGVDPFDFDKYIMKNNGNNHLDNYWVRFEDFGAKSFYDIRYQEYPVRIHDAG